MTSPDTEFGTFSDAGPWVIDPDALAWRRGLAGVRRRLTASLPRLTRPGTLPPVRRLATTVRHAGPALALWYLRERRRGGTESIAGISRRLRVVAERLGPTYIKLGQIIASGDGVFPPELVAEFKWCRDQVTPEPWAVVEQVLTEELGGPLSTVFASVEHTPLAAASIAQVHAATLRDGTACGGQGPAALGVGAGAPGSRRHGLAGAPPGGPDPRRRAGQPARAGGALRRDDRRGARLPARGREHARCRHDLRRARPARLRRAPPPPDTGHAPHARDGTARRLPLR